MRRRHVQVVLARSVVVVSTSAALFACGEPRKEANTALRPTGSGWFCWRNTRIPNASRCMRTKEECGLSRSGAKSAAGNEESSLETFTECEPRPAAGCYTSVSAKNGAESFTCAESVNDCEYLRRTIERDPDQSGNYASFSSCASWD